MDKNEHEELDLYVIPPNFIEGGKLFDGMFKMRNAIEAEQPINGLLQMIKEYSVENINAVKTFYISNAGFTQTDGNKILKYLNWNDVENILQYMNVKWKNLSGVDLNGTTPGSNLPNKSDKEELSKNYELGALNQNGIIVVDPDGDLREGDK